MPQEIVLALISLASVVGSAFLSSFMLARKTQAIVEFRVGQLEKKVDEHNHLDSRMVKVETSAKSAHTRLNGHEAQPHAAHCKNFERRY